ncbi:MAG: dockerin type I repeat-containing protein [Bacteroidaceae bacterium]|nr:dockerin type I repeat-containing protein [Bacteroidaceae bacterium]
MKKTMIVLSVALCMFFAQAWAENEVKVQVSASSNGANIISGTVYDDYSFAVTLPPKSISVSGDITAKLVLNDVLGVTGEKTLTKTLGEGQSIDGVSVTDSLSNCYNFDGASANVVVHDRTKSQAFTYTASRNGSVISGTTNAADAAAAWTILAEAVAHEGENTEGVFAEIKKGTYVQIGDEKLIFDDNLDLFKGDWRPNGITAALNQIIIDAKAVAHIEQINDLKEKETYVGVLFIPEDSKIGAGNHTATLTEPCEITLDLSNAHQENKRVSGKITELVNKLDAEGKTKAVLASVNLFDQIVGMIDGAETVDVDVRLGYLRGDVNKDGDVNVTDVTALVSMILGNSVKNDMSDVNADGDVNVTDVTALVSIILGK